MHKSNRPFIPVNDYSEFNLIIIVRWNEWPVGIANNYTALFKIILTGQTTEIIHLIWIKL